MSLLLGIRNLSNAFPYAKQRYKNGRLATLDRGLVLVGTDTLVVEVVPNPDPALAFPVHGELIAKNGIHLHENLDLSRLTQDEVYQFAYIFVRLPIVGGTGSPGSPIAVR